MVCSRPTPSSRSGGGRFAQPPDVAFSLNVERLWAFADGTICLMVEREDEPRYEVVCHAGRGGPAPGSPAVPRQRADEVANLARRPDSGAAQLPRRLAPFPPDPGTDPGTRLRAPRFHLRACALQRTGRRGPEGPPLSGNGCFMLTTELAHLDPTAAKARTIRPADFVRRRSACPRRRFWWSWPANLGLERSLDDHQTAW